MNARIAIGIVVAVLALGVVGFQPSAPAAEEKSPEQMIAEAKTPADHEAIAAFYKEEAQAARQKQTRHERMKLLYLDRCPMKMVTMRSHCESIAQKYTGMAEDYETLVQLHKEMATEAQ